MTKKHLNTEQASKYTGQVKAICGRSFASQDVSLTLDASKVTCSRCCEIIAR